MMENIRKHSSWTLFTICLGMGISIMYQLRCNLNAFTPDLKLGMRLETYLTVDVSYISTPS